MERISRKAQSADTRERKTVDATFANPRHGLLFRHQ
jgi:hypothetical protein